MEKNENQKNIMTSKELKFRFWGLWLLAILSLVASIYASTANAIFGCS